MIEASWNFHCAEFSAAWLREQTGRDVWAEIGGCPRSCREAAFLLRRLNVRSLREATSRVLGDEIVPAMAMRGDIVYSPHALGVCRGEKAEFVDRFLPMREIVCAWRVGRHG